MFAIVADTPATEPGLDAALRLRAPGLPDLRVAHPDRTRRRRPAALPRAAGRPRRRRGRRVGPPGGRAATTCAWSGATTRPAAACNPGYSEPGDHTAYADGYPVTVASLASLRQLNDWIVEGALERGEEPPEPLPMERFRPNLVVDGDEPFAEDDWTTLTVGDVRFRVAKPTDRCVMTTIDLVSLTTGKEPIRTLARHRLVGDKTLFAVHLVPVSERQDQRGRRGPSAE